MATLLLADDSVTIQRVIELTFADEGVRVISVSDGESAIARMNVERPDIVLADAGMPNVDGYQVAAHVKATPALAHVPVLLLTGAFEPIDEDRARHAGCDGVLVKPFEPRQLIETVRRLLDEVRAPDARSGDGQETESGDEPVDTAAEPGQPEPIAEVDEPVPAPQDAEAPAGGAAGSLASVFSALLAAEQGHPDGRLPKAASPALSEAAVELLVERVVRRMTGELIRKTVLETAERLIREELDRSKLQA